MPRLKTKSWKLPPAVGHYHSDGRLYPAGSVITLPAKHKPAKGWVEVRVTKRKPDYEEIKDDDDDDEPQNSSEPTTMAEAQHSSPGRPPGA